MMRGFGEHALIRDALPDWVAVVFGLVTQLGDTWFLAVLLLVLFWYAIPSRRDVAFVVGAWFAGIGLYRGLKVTLAFPRPAEPPLAPESLPVVVDTVYELTAFASGYGFPSGHAVNTTVVYFGLASVLAVSTVRRRYAAAATIVAAVCAARVVLGLHYLVDVLAGVALALALLFGIREIADRHSLDPAIVAFGTAIPLATFYVVASEAEFESIVLLAAAAVGFVSWRRYGSDAAR